MQVGDLLRFHKTHDTHHPDSPMWLIVTETRDDESRLLGDVIIRGGWRGNQRGTSVYASSVGEFFTVVPVDDAPDDVLVALAKHRMGVTADADR